MHEARRHFTTTRLFGLSMLVGLLGAAGCDSGSVAADCQAIIDACHNADSGNGPAHDCHEFAETAGRSASECSMRKAECLNTCAPLAQTLLVAHEALLVSYDVATGQERPGTIQNISGPTDMTALPDGQGIVNLTNRNEVLIFDIKSMLETVRIPSSGNMGKRPVHGFVTPERAGKQYWMVANDGENDLAATNSASFIDIAPGSATRFQRVGEVPLGMGHHKAAFSNTTSRVVISNISDCNNVLTVYDYSNIASIQALETFTGTEAGWTAADPGAGNFDPRFCDQTFMRGAPPAPHGCATSKVSNKVYCNLTGSGEMVVVAIDATPPTFDRVPTNGKGGGYTLAHPAGRYLYTLQEEPREAMGGTACQIGQLAVTDAMTDMVVNQVALFYEGPGCTKALTGTPAQTANPGHARFGQSGNRLFISTSGGFNVTDARVNQVLVVDTTNPAAPVQRSSITTGLHTGHGADAASGDGKYDFVVASADGQIAQIDMATETVARTFTVKPNPKNVATYGTVEGPNVPIGPIP